ncbi:MAG TPA: hypothetical protein VFP65_05675 [Anaeromyxobacteraceae bacterium]|nr:hypothetical protein [Anaeromyxobacteraceae bacterium]
MSSSTSNNAALALDEPSEAPRGSPQDAARRYLEELLAEKPELLDALSGLVARDPREERGGEPPRAVQPDRCAERPPLGLARDVGRAGAESSDAREGPPHVCSWCRRVRVTPDRWVPAGDYARQYGGGRRSPGASVVFHLATNGICPDCYVAVLGHDCGCAHGGRGGTHD